MFENRTYLLCVPAIALASFSFGLRAQDAAVAPPPIPNATSLVHTVRTGDTLASIAQLYYGRAQRESVLVAENNLVQDRNDVVIGQRIVIPHVTYHRLRVGDTFASLAEHYLGDARRAFALTSVNGGGDASTRPDVGAELVIPAVIRYTADGHESLNRIAEKFFGNEDASRALRRFNNLRGTRPARGQTLLLPLADLVLTEDARRMIASSAAQVGDAGGSARAVQQRIQEQLPHLAEYIERGLYAETIALGNRLLGAETLTGNQFVTIYRALATAYVALDEDELAERAFRLALVHQPDLELDARLTSPTVLRAFAIARQSGVEIRDAGTE